MKTKVLGTALALSFAGFAAGCGSDEGGGGSAAQNKDPLKVVLIPPSGGALAQMGADATRGWEYAAAEVNAKGGVDGHRVEIVKVEHGRDTAGDGPRSAQGRHAGRGAIHQRHHHVAGARRAPAAASGHERHLAARARQGRRADRRRVQPERVPRRAFDVDGDLGAQRGARDAAGEALGGPVGRLLDRAHRRGELQEGSGGRRQERRPAAVLPLGTTDWGSSITKLKAADADGLFALVPGADGIAFINQATQFKLFDQYKTVFGFQMLSEPALKALGDKVLGFYGNVGYDVTADNAKNKAFVDGYTKKYGSAPYGVPADHYLAAQMLFEAVQKSKSVDPTKVKAALSGLSFDSFAGPVQIAKDHQLVRPAYVGKVVKQGDVLGYEVVAEVPGAKSHPTPNPACKA